jgi:hypothetical protein
LQEISQSRKKEGKMMKSIVINLLVIVAIILYSPVISAQRGPLAEGDKVKIVAGTISDKALNGNVLHISDTDLSINSGGLYYYFPFRSIDRIERSIGKKGNTKRGMIIGGISGGLVIGLFEWASYAPCTETGFLACAFYPESRGVALQQGAVAGVILGGAVGGIIGTFWKTDNWRPVSLPVQYYQAKGYQHDFHRPYTGLTVQFTFQSTGMNR